MNQLTDEQKEHLRTVEENCEGLGFHSMARAIAMGEIALNENNYCKGNLPDSIEDFKRGNGEGVWIIPYTDSDQAIYDDESRVGETFEAIVLNDCLYYPFPYGTLITFENRGESRPVLSYEWLDEIIQATSNWSMNLETYLTLGED